MWLFVTLSLVSVVFFVVSYLGQQQILDQNKCEMTLSKREERKAFIPMNSSLTSFSLWRYSNVNSRKLNDFPVLFIPGHQGSADQARSFASDIMHNKKGELQYFSIDFGEGSSSGVHGSHVVNQALFVNQALRKIVTLYREKGTEPPRITLLAHSAGGMVARLAILLSNHPTHCVVSSIVMLNSPNSRPAFTPDLSLDVLYGKINLAWRSSYFNETTACRRKLDDAVSGRVLKYKRLSPVTVDWACSLCSSSVRVVSVSGGELDMLVAPSLTLLDRMTPQPSNRSVEKPPGPGLETILKTKNQVIEYVTGTAYSIVFGAVNVAIKGFSFVKNSIDYMSSGSENSASSVTGGNGSNVPPSVVDDVADVSDDDLLPMTANMTSRWQRITNAHWERHMVSYSEPQVFTIRTSQMAHVGFPVDHQAILWCHQLVDVVHKSILKLAQIPEDYVMTLDELFDLKDPLGKVPSNLVLPLNYYLARNETKVQWEQAVVTERQFMFDQFPYALLILGVTYISSHVMTVLPCFVVQSCMMITVPLLKGIAGDIDSIVNEDIADHLDPLVHFHFAVFAKLLSPLYKSLMPPALSNSKFSNPMVVVSFMAPFLAYFLYQHQFHPFYFVERYDGVVTWVVSYGLALTIHAILFLVFYCIRVVLSLIISALYTALRWTIWCKPVRQFTRKATKSMKKKLPKVVSNNIFNIIGVQCLLVMFLILVGVSWSSSLGFGNYLISILEVYAYLLIVLCCVWIVLFQNYIMPNSCSKQMINNVAFLYGLGALMCAPSVMFSGSLLFSAPGFHLGVSVYDAFGPPRLTQCCCLLAVLAHLLLLISHPFIPFEPLEWAESLCASKDKKDRVRKSDGNYFTTMSKVLDSSDRDKDAVGCCHEDGGTYAIFEEFFAPAACRNVNSPADAAPAMEKCFKVIYCKCAQDKSLQDIRQYCEWCLCSKCGGKGMSKKDRDLLRSMQNSNLGMGSVFDDTKASDFSPDLGLLLVILAIAVWSLVYAQDIPHKHVQIVGLVAASFVAREIASLWKKW